MAASLKNKKEGGSMIIRFDGHNRTALWPEIVLFEQDDPVDIIIEKMYKLLNNNGIPTVGNIQEGLTLLLKKGYKTSVGEKSRQRMLENLEGLVGGTRSSKMKVVEKMDTIIRREVDSSCQPPDNIIHFPDGK
jgi:hypothetical protein